MDKQALKDMLYGSIAELAKNTKYYNNSPFGSKYCYYTEAGERAVLEILQVWTHKVLEEQQQSLDQHAKKLVIEGLKDSD